MDVPVCSVGHNLKIGERFRLEQHLFWKFCLSDDLEQIASSCNSQLDALCLKGFRALLGDGAGVILLDSRPRTTLNPHVSLLLNGTTERLDWTGLVPALASTTPFRADLAPLDVPRPELTAK